MCYRQALWRQPWVCGTRGSRNGFGFGCALDCCAISCPAEAIWMCRSRGIVPGVAAAVSRYGGRQDRARGSAGSELLVAHRRAACRPENRPDATIWGQVCGEKRIFTANFTGTWPGADGTICTSIRCGKAGGKVAEAALVLPATLWPICDDFRQGLVSGFALLVRLVEVRY